MRHSRRKGRHGLEWELAHFRGIGADDAAETLRQRWFGRMWDISAFMKTLKQRFSQWFNGRHKRRGTLWEDRFRSVLVEGKGNALRAMAAYIDLNPVRAKICDDPKGYRWCGYAETVAGGRRAKEALRWLAGTRSPRRNEAGLSLCRGCHGKLALFSLRRAGKRSGAGGER